jgi:hypothetical protein
LNITVIRFTQLGIPVKSIEVPLVDATAVASVFMEFVPVPAWMVKVLDPDTAGTDNVTVPDVSPDKTSELIYFLYKMTQREPDGTVTATVVSTAPLSAVCEGLTT